MCSKFPLKILVLRKIILISNYTANPVGVKSQKVGFVRFYDHASPLLSLSLLIAYGSPLSYEREKISKNTSKKRFRGQAKKS